VRDALLCQGLLANRAGVPEQAYHAALAASPDRLLLLTAQGARSAPAPRRAPHVMRDDGDSGLKLLRHHRHAIRRQNLSSRLL